MAATLLLTNFQSENELCTEKDDDCEQEMDSTCVEDELFSEKKTSISFGENNTEKKGHQPLVKKGKAQHNLKKNLKISSAGSSVPKKEPPSKYQNADRLQHMKENVSATPIFNPNVENFCDMYCCHNAPYFTKDPCLAGRPPWTSYYSSERGRCNCHSSLFRERLACYLGADESKGNEFKPTEFIVDERYYLFPSSRTLASEQKRPLWGMPSTQWEIDAINGKRGYRKLNNDPPITPLPTFFQPLAANLKEMCEKDDEEFENRTTVSSIFPDVIPHCPGRRVLSVHRDYRGRRPKGTPRSTAPDPEEDPLVKKLMQEMQMIFNEFLAQKVPIIWVYGRPLKTVSGTRRNYCLSLAETHGFTYLSLDEEIALLAARGSKAIQAGNPLFERFSAVERLALPVCIKLVTDKTYVLSRTEALDMLKFLMLKYFPTRGYVIDGFPWDDTDNGDFEKTFYPVACGLYFLDSHWTANKAIPPAVIPPLYFRRDLTYDENDVEEACGKFGLKTLKIIGAESMLDEDEKVFALHAIVDEYLDAYDEVLEGNEDVLIDDKLEYQTFGETKGYGLDLGDYMKRRKPPQDEEEEEEEDGQDENEMGKTDEGEQSEARRRFLELDPLKEAKWDASEALLGKYSSAMFDLGRLKVTPSQRQISSDDSKDGKKKRKHRHRKKRKGDKHDDDSCPEGEVCSEHGRKSKRRGKHRCKCRCKCHRRKHKGDKHHSDDDDDDDYYDGDKRRRSHKRSSKSGAHEKGGHESKTTGKRQKKDGGDTDGLLSLYTRGQNKRPSVGTDHSQVASGLHRKKEENTLNSNKKSRLNGNDDHKKAETEDGNTKADNSNYLRSVFPPGEKGRSSPRDNNSTNDGKDEKGKTLNNASPIISGKANAPPTGGQLSFKFPRRPAIQLDNNNNYSMTNNNNGITTSKTGTIFSKSKSNYARQLGANIPQIVEIYTSAKKRRESSQNTPHPTTRQNDTSSDRNHQSIVPGSKAGDLSGVSKNNQMRSSINSSSDYSQSVFSPTDTSATNNDISDTNVHENVHQPHPHFSGNNKGHDVNRPGVTKRLSHTETHHENLKRFTKGRDDLSKRHPVNDDVGVVDGSKSSKRHKAGRKHKKNEEHENEGGESELHASSESQLDNDMDQDGPFVYDKRWGFRSTKRLGKHPSVYLPRLSTTNVETDLTEKENDIDKRAKERVGVYSLPHSQSHNIPDPYNTIPHKLGDKPGDYLHDYPGPKAPDRFSKINRKKIEPSETPSATTSYTTEPTSGLRSLYSDTMSRVMAKNQADIRKIKYDKLKQKVGQVEYEIYQDDYRLPKYRFYKTYLDYTPEDFLKEKENYVPCANCFDSFKQADQFNKGEQVMTLSHIQHERHEAQEEHDRQYGKGPLFNRIISCLCGEDNEAGFHIPGYKPEPTLEDNTDLEQFDKTPDYRKKK